jgi:peptide/nickel transport system permease protein
MSLLVFAGVYAVGNPVDILVNPQSDQSEIARATAALGLDPPLAEQYVLFLKDVATGNLGKSFAYNVPAIGLILERMPATLELASAAMLIALVLGIPLGLWAGVAPRSAAGRAIAVGSILGFSLPTFWVGLMLIMVFSVWLGWLPAGGTGSLQHMILPAFSLGLFDAGVIARQSRAGLLDVLEQDYIRTARAKGLAERMVVVRHAFKNAVIPVVTVIGMQFGRMLGGAVLVESVFSLPGIGRLLVTAISQRDYPVIQGICLLLAASFVIINLVVDITYGYLDPRIRQ